MFQKIDSPSGLTIYHTGPKLTSDRPLPALFYFALSGEESLTLDPYNQPIAFLKNENIHTFSFTLPYHGEGFDNKQAIPQWSKEFQQNHDIITPFIEQCHDNIEYLLIKKFITKNIATAGLSRGAFIATQLAARNPHVKTILGFSPLTQFGVMNDFSDLRSNPIAQNLSLSNLIPKLTDKTLRFYIGNHDSMVDTAFCFNFIKDLTEASFNANHRSPPIELIIFPSIGHKGHGTPPHIFSNGAQWVCERLKPGE